MITPVHSYPRAKRKARRRGRSHGRQGLPSKEWTGGPVPYLETLHANYSQQIAVLDQNLRIIEGQSITSGEEDIANKKSQEYQIAIRIQQAKLRGIGISLRGCTRLLCLCLQLVNIL
jgi:hypothetical protein